MMNSMKKKITVLALLVSSFNIYSRSGTTEVSVIFPNYSQYKLHQYELDNGGYVKKKNVFDFTDQAHTRTFSPQHDLDSRYFVTKDGKTLSRLGKPLEYGQKEKDSYFFAKEFAGYAAWNWRFTPQGDVIREGLDSDKKTILYQEVNGNVTYDKRKK